MKLYAAGPLLTVILYAIACSQPSEANLNANRRLGLAGQKGYKMNISEALMKAAEAKPLNELKDANVAVLQGIGPFSSQVMEKLGVKTVNDLATYKYFLMARAIKTLAETETEGGRLDGSVMNIDKAVDKEWESKSLRDIVDAPIQALQGMSNDSSDLLEAMNVKTIGDLADFKYCRWAESVVTLAAYEETHHLRRRV